MHSQKRKELDTWQQTPADALTLPEFTLHAAWRTTATTMALPTNGRVIVDTSAGEIDIELWSKVRTHATATAYSIPNPSSQEAPKTCRNFIQLAMEGQWHAVLITVSDPPNMPSQVTMTVSSSTGESPASCPSTAQSELMGPPLVFDQDSAQLPRADGRQDGNRRRWRVRIRRYASCTYGHALRVIEMMAAEPFEDEIHPRLRFPHRGIVAMANNGQKHSNDSQFFITLGK